MSSTRTMLLILALAAALAATLRLARDPASEPSGEAQQRAGAAFIVVVNPGPTRVELDLAFQAIAGACPGGPRAWRDQRRLEPGAMLRYDAGPGGGPWPEDCALAVSLQASGGEVAALAFSDWDARGRPSALAFRPVAEAAAGLSFPAWTRPRIAGDASRLYLRQLGDRPAELRLRLFDAQGRERDCGAACLRRLSPGESTVWRLEEIGALRAGELGSARVESSQPLIGAAASRGALEASGLGQLLYLAEPDDPAGRSDLVLRFPELPRQAPPPSPLAARYLGAGEAWLAIQAGAAGADAIRLLATGEQDEPTLDRDLGMLEPGLTLGLDLPGLLVGGAPALPDGRHAGRVEAKGALAGLALLRWPQAKLALLHGAAPVDTELLLPLSWRQQPGRASWITVQAAEASARVRLELYEAAGGTAPKASLDLAVPAQSRRSVDLDDDRLGQAGAGSFWLRLRSNQPVAALALSADGQAEPWVLAYPGLGPAQLGEILHLPLFFLGRPDAPEQATAEPPATRTALADPRPTPTATSRPALPSGAALERRYDLAPLGRGARLVALASAPDGSVWLRAARPGGGERLVRLAPDGSRREFDGLAELLASAPSELGRAGSLAGFWSLDAEGRAWIGARYLQSGRLRQLAGDEDQPSGALQWVDRVALDGAGRAWVPRQARTDCLRPEGCGYTSLLAFDAQGRTGLAVDLGPGAASGRAALVEPRLLDSRAAGGGGLSLQSAPGQRPQQQPGEAAWAVTAGALHALPDPAPIAFPGLEPPADATALRHAGYATAAGIDERGRPVVLTWLELQTRSGRTVQPALRMNTWLPASADWLPPVELAGPGRVDPLLDPALDQITAAAWCGGAGPWLGTARGIVARWDGQAFDRYLRPGLPAELPAAPVQALACAPGGGILIASGDGLFWQDGEVLARPAEVLLPFLSKLR